MARLIPSEFDLDPLARDRHAPEARTLLRLRDGLGDGFVVYHGVHWTRADGSGSVYGEIDFIVANRWGRLLAIEQKDAHIVVGDHDLYAR